MQRAAIARPSKGGRAAVLSAPMSAMASGMREPDRVGGRALGAAWTVMSMRGVGTRMTSPSRSDINDREGGVERGAELTTDRSGGGDRGE